MNKILKNPWSILILIALFHVINNSIIISLDKTFPMSDEQDNLIEASQISQTFTSILKSPQEAYSWYYNLGGRCRAPLYRIILSLACIPKINMFGIFIINSLFFIVLLFSVYGIGTKLQSSLSGVLAAFILSMFSGIFAMSRVSMLDFPLTAAISLSVYLMLLTKNFTNLKYTIFFGISVGLGMLIKVTYINFILPITVFYIFSSIVKNLRQNTNVSMIVKNLTIFLLCSLLISGSWYFPNLNRVIQRAQAVCYLSTLLPQYSFWTVFSSYMNWLFFYNIGPFFCVLSLAGLFLCLIRRKFALLFIWFWIPLLIFSLSPNAVPRFMLPLLPAISLIIAMGIVAIKTSLIRKMLVIIIVVYSVISFFVISYDKAFLGSILKEDIPNRVDRGIIYPVRNINWKTEEIMKFILGQDYNKESINTKLRCLLIPNVPEIAGELRYYILNRGIGLNIECPAEMDPYDFQYNTTPYLLSEFDFIITKEGYQGVDANNHSWFSNLSNLFEQYKNDFYLVGCVKGLPDGSEVYVWSKNAERNKIP